MGFHKQSAIMGAVLYLLMAAIIYIGYAIFSDPARMDRMSPFSAAGPATRMASGLTASIGGVAAPWPDWVTQRDRETLERAVKTMRGGESRKLMTTLMTFQDELEERGHGVLELKGVVISHLAGDVIATSLTPLVFAALMTVALAFISSALSRAALNPLDAIFRGVSYLVGVAGSVALRFFMAGGFFAFFIIAGLWMRPFPNLLYGATEAAAWGTTALAALWLAALTGMANAPKPRMEKCGTCNGAGFIPAKAPAAQPQEPALVIEETSQAKPPESPLA